MSTKEYYTTYNREYHLKYKQRINERHKKYREENPSYHLQHSYGITLEEYNKMLSKQLGVCSICKQPEKIIHNRTKEIKSLAVDHCHTTGKVRSLLCHSCNLKLGIYEANKIIFEEYLNATT